MPIAIYIVTEKSADDISHDTFTSQEEALSHAAAIAVENIGGTLEDAYERFSNFDDIREGDYEVYVTESSIDSIPVTLNTFDNSGNVVDTTTMNLNTDTISDIIDHAAQLIIVKRDGGDTSDVLWELEEALQTADVIASEVVDLEQ
ncbi:hypothetical protein FY034_17415 (plasmid) [Trichlorobacter lovleyi]|uniref:hypothetical protein n=1 Tax=Trichlorobacter lovleyi TaxID=313985 RepID=UPI002240117D|nr:hypothetical protein [Trichlorobacter lovleyi]QOX80803.1 hypothetical protein FY034_17415 [Trichlorobacter lovleyi]